MNRRKQKKLSGRLVEAALCAEAGTVRALVRAGADPGGTNAHGTTPLYAAAVGGATEIVTCLLDAGACPDAESRDETEGTPLCAAAAWGHADVVRLLLAHGADPGLREDDGEGRSPLEWAGSGHHTETVALLLAAGARSPDGTTRAATPAGRQRPS
ncbi:ankyrin repeat domain-containing protein [Streptomyces sp. NEAU-W12]|uniref:ankyrin repeat domain-containing protein n=1 Tax=Streptomyces sp. NEAU-W12 TaxID=2994668 RepID=UPI00224B7F7A|nr:ankyrin repeat domain-containing protein [Streptomyces sp. NEAU-W12]MCX2922450.1 ankyrin repeat domain-containing protein [Streptomyces sp. NEAU-W12]